MAKFQLESKYMVSCALPQKKKDFNGGIKIHDSAWTWLTQMRSRTGMPVAQIVDQMVSFCDANLEIVPVGRQTKTEAEPQERSTEELLLTINALLVELNNRIVGAEEEE